MHSWHDVVRHIAASPDFESLLAGVSEFMVSGSRVLLFVVCFVHSNAHAHRDSSLPNLLLAPRREVRSANPLNLSI